ncbi:DUF4384 domain-containing protein [Deinococcus sonorensis]|uniref:DUF4384 domain-containing protein n=2 Tax=Deinococcus sonorensis TaxID=309891 RepID=A0AAU7UA76_9DEIO
MNKILLTALIAPVALGTAMAAPKISAQSIIVNPVETSLTVKVWTDRDSTGTQTPNYNVGDRIRIYTSVNQDAYVYLFNVDPNGKVDLILPNRYAGGANFLKANTVKAFPSAGDPFTFDIAAPYGVNKVLALASKTQLNLDQIADFKSQNAQATKFADVNVQGQGQLAQALSIVVNPVPQNTWISDIAYYNVAGGTSTTPPVQPVPVQTPPTQPQQGGYPAYSVTSQTEWRTAFTSSTATAASVYNFYTAELQRQGFTLVGTRQERSRIAGQFRSNSGTAELRVSESGNSNRFDVVIIRRS